MAAYRLFFKKSVQKDFGATPKKDLGKILDSIAALADDPRPSGYEKLSGQDRYRLRQGRYRIVYSIQDDELTVWVFRSDIVSTSTVKTNISLHQCQKPEGFWHWCS